MKARKVPPRRKPGRKPRAMTGATVPPDRADPSASDYRAWRDELLE